MKDYKEKFVNGEYARWIKEFQQRNPLSVSFSNSIEAINKSTIKLASLKPLAIETDEIKAEDFANIVYLDDYFDYLRDVIGKQTQQFIIIRIDGINYTLYEDKKDDERIIRVVNVSDKAEIDITID